MADDTMELERAVYDRLLLELNMTPFSVIKVLTDGRIVVDYSALAGWLAPAVVNLIQPEEE